jgi:short-subunit dehydrogenase
VIIRDSVVLVTGATSGIGRSTAEELARRGARVVVHGRDATAVAELAERIGAAPVTADLAQPEQTARLATETLAVAGRVDIVVANAGVGYFGPFGQMPTHDIESLVEVNLTAAVRLTRALLPAMVDRGNGYFAYVSSIAGRIGVAGESVYAATKAGLDVFAESLRLELRGSGVGVGVLVPGVVATSFFDRRGRPYGRTMPKPLPVGLVADRIVRMIERDSAEAYEPGWLRLPVAVRGVAPAVYRALAARFGGS